MTMKGRWLLVAGVVAVMLATPPASGCELAGPNTHVGKIKAIEPVQQNFTIIDQQMKKAITFHAAPEQLKGLSLGQRVAVNYSEADGRLKAEKIEVR